MYVTEFTVSGKGHFPLDMLRYDACHPARSEDVSLIGDGPTRTINLRKHTSTKEPNITRARWESFGWSVGLGSIHSVKV